MRNPPVGDVVDAAGGRVSRCVPVTHIYCEVFRANIYFIHDVPIKELNGFIKRQFKLDPKKQQLEGTCIEILPNVAHVIYVREIARIWILAHEAYHCVKQILSNRGINDEETEAYLLDYIIRECLK